MVFPSWIISDIGFTQTQLSSANSFCPRTDYYFICVIKFLSTCVLNGVHFYTCFFISISSKFAALFFICTEWILYVCYQYFFAEDERLQTRRPHLSGKEPRAFPRIWPMIFSRPLIRNDYFVISFCHILLLDFVWLFILQNTFLNKNKCQLN